MIDGLDVELALERLHSNELTTAGTVDGLLAVAGDAVVAKPDLAVLALDLVERLAPTVGSDHAVPAAQYLRARSALNRGLTDEALELIERSRVGWQALGRPLDAFRTELGRMHVLDDLGRHADAAAAARTLLSNLAALDQADGIDQDNGLDQDNVVDRDNDVDRDNGLDPDDREQLAWMQAAANENLGVATGFTGHHEEALAAYERAEQAYRSVGGLDDLARCRANRGVELVAIGRAVEGLDALLSASSMFTEAENRLSYAQCIGHAAEAELLLGLYAASLERFREAERLLDELGAVTEANRLRLRSVQAYLILNLVDEAAATAEEVIGKLDEAGLEHDLAEARWMAAIACIRNEEPEAAIEILAASIAGAKAVGDPALAARAQLTRSEALAAIDRRAEALSAAEDALAGLTEGKWPVEEVHTRLWLAQLLDDRGSVESHLDRATELVDDLALPQLRYPLLVQLGRRDRERGDNETARQRLEEAIDILESLRGLIPDEMLRSSYLEGRTMAHVELISMLIDGSDEERRTAFDLSEASKSRTLDDIMAGTVRPIQSTMNADDPVLARYEADLHAAYSALTSGAPDRTRGQRRALHDRAVELERAIRLGHLRAEAGETTAVESDPTDDPRPDVRPGRARPGVNQQVVEYHIVGDRIIIFVWCDGQLNVVEATTGREVVNELIGHWERTRQRYELARGLGAGGAHGMVEGSNDALRSLWVALFEPVAPLLDDGGVLIVPHGPLHVVPFHALVGPDGPVGSRWTVTMAPSFSVASQLSAGDVLSPVGSSGVGRSVVVGVPDEAAPAVADEANRTADSLPGAELLLGPQATVENLLTSTADPVDVLHLACHGIHRARNPMFSALKLADRWLTARDVLTMTVPGALVVLSACESGRQQPGQHREETIGLARSFVAAGAAAVVVSLWLTADEVAAEFMQHFYRALTTASPADALRLAQAAVAVDHQHPADWASFIIYGGITR